MYICYTVLVLYLCAINTLISLAYSLHSLWRQFAHQFRTSDNIRHTKCD